MKKEVFLSVTQTLYKKSETDLADDLKTVDGEDVDDTLAETIIKRLDAEKVGTLKADATKRFNDGIGKGTKDASKKFEDKLVNFFGIEDTTLKGDDLLEHIETEIVPTIGAGGGDTPDFKKITADDLDKIPAVKKLKQDHTKALLAKDTEKDAAIKAEQDKVNQSSILNDVIAQGFADLESRNPILPDDAVKAKNQKDRLFANELKNYKFAKDAKGVTIPVDADGNQLEDDNGVVLEVKDLYSRIAESNFEFAVTDDKNSFGDKSKSRQHQQQSKVYKGGDPGSVDKYTELILDENLEPEVKEAIREAYSEKYSG